MECEYAVAGGSYMGDIEVWCDTHNKRISQGEHHVFTLAEINEIIENHENHEGKERE